MSFLLYVLLFYLLLKEKALHLFQKPRVVSWCLFSAVFAQCALGWMAGVAPGTRGAKPGGEAACLQTRKEPWETPRAAG